MRFEVTIFLVTAFLIYNTYHDGKYTKMFKMNAKYFKMASYAFGALSLYIFTKRFPQQGKNLAIHANEMIKYMPIDRNTSDIITPFLNFTNETTTLENNGSFSSPIREKPSSQIFYNSQPNFQPSSQYQNQPSQQNSSIQQGGTIQQKHKRSVSETKKKFVASNQQWKCGHCNMQLDHTFEVDHIVDLQYGGSNHADNLVALCRNCHGKKTMQRHIQ